MGRMLTEQVTRVNEGLKRVYVGGRVTSRWQGMKIERGVPKIIAETGGDSILQVTDRGE
jgi:hypothetical protein